MHSKLGEFDKALPYLEKIKGTPEHHFRFYAPVLCGYCATNPEKAWEMFLSIRSFHLLPTEQAYVDLIRCLPSKKEYLIADMATVLEEVTYPFGVESNIADSVCSKCKNKLALVDIGDGEKKEIIGTICTQVKEVKLPSYNIVIDGANVGFFDNKGRTDAPDLGKIDRILSLLPSNYRPLIVLHKRHIKKNKEWAAKHAEILYITPYGENDDKYWLYCALRNDCLLVSNDEMKDHAFEALKQKEFTRWKSCHVVHYDLRTLYFPAPFTTCIQKAGDHWHFPCAGKWLCLE